MNDAKEEYINVIVFPKAFEWRKFISRIKHYVIVCEEYNGLVEDIQEKGIHTYVVCVNLSYNKENPEYCGFFCIVIDDSDIKFNSLLTTYISRLKTKHVGEDIKKFKFRLFGTCGAIHEKYIDEKERDEYRVGSCHEIKGATKGDRGILNSSGKYIPTKKKIDKAFVYIPDGKDIPTTRNRKEIETNIKEVCSCNWLVESEKGISINNDNIASFKLYEMETYDFFTICEVQEVRTTPAFRIISDICGNKQGLTRRLCSFDQGIDRLLFEIKNTTKTDKEAGTVEEFFLATKTIDDEIDKAKEGERSEKDKIKKGSEYLQRKIKELLTNTDELIKNMGKIYTKTRGPDSSGNISQNRAKYHEHIGIKREHSEKHYKVIAEEINEIIESKDPSIKTVEIYKNELDPYMFYFAKGYINKLEEVGNTGIKLKLMGFRKEATQEYFKTSKVLTSEDDKKIKEEIDEYLNNMRII